MKIRCSSRIHGIVDDRGLLEVKCVSQKCGAGKGRIVFHYFDLTTGLVVETKRYRDPEHLLREKKG